MFHGLKLRSVLGKLGLPEPGLRRGAGWSWGGMEDMGFAGGTLLSCKRMVHHPPHFEMWTCLSKIRPKELLKSISMLTYLSDCFNLKGSTGELCSLWFLGVELDLKPSDPEPSARWLFPADLSVL